MATAAIAAARQPADPGMGKLAPRRSGDGVLHSFRGVAGFPLVGPQPAAEHPVQFRRLARWRQLFGLWRGLLRWRRLVGRRRGFGELVMSMSSHDRERIAAAIRAAETNTSG